MDNSVHLYLAVYICLYYFSYFASNLLLCLSAIIQLSHFLQCILVSCLSQISVSHKPKYWREKCQKTRLFTEFQGWWSQQPESQSLRCCPAGTNLDQHRTEVNHISIYENVKTSFDGQVIILLDVSRPSWAWTQCSSSIVSFNESLSVLIRCQGDKDKTFANRSLKKTEHEYICVQISQIKYSHLFLFVASPLSLWHVYTQTPSCQPF